MRAFTTVTAKVAPLDRPNVDTDAIIPPGTVLKSINCGTSMMIGPCFNAGRFQ